MWGRSCVVSLCIYINQLITTPNQPFPPCNTPNTQKTPTQHPPPTHTHTRTHLEVGVEGEGVVVRHAALLRGLAQDAVARGGERDQVPPQFRLGHLGGLVDLCGGEGGGDLWGCLRVCVYGGGGGGVSEWWREESGE
jgi:hypothetical protein